MPAATPEQLDFYQKNKQRLVGDYLADFPLRIDPDAVRDLFIEIGYNRNNVKEYEEVCGLLTEDIFYEALKRKAGNGKLIFAAGLPGSGKSTLLTSLGGSELIYDGTLNDDEKFVRFINDALALGYRVEALVLTAPPGEAFRRNLGRGDSLRRYVPISHYEKVAATLNKRHALLKRISESGLHSRNFEYKGFTAKAKRFSKIKIDRDELKRIANEHQFPDRTDFHYVIN
jgi:predicted kinase